MHRRVWLKISQICILLCLITNGYGMTIPDKYTEINSYKIHYYDTGGDKNVILFVHGLPLNADSWRPQIEYFKRQFRVVALDLPGYGLSSALPAPLPAELSAWYANIISQFLKKLNIAKAVYIGFASAGHIGIKFAAQYPAQAEKLVMINASPQFNQGKGWSSGFTRAQNQAFINKINNDDFRKTIEFLIDAETQQACDGGMKQLRERFYAMGMMSSKATLLGFFSHIANENYRPLLKQIQAPTLIITSNQGKEVSQNVGIYLRTHIPDSQLVEINHAEHFVFATAAEYVNSVIERFLNPVCTF